MNTCACPTSTDCLGVCVWGLSTCQSVADQFCLGRREFTQLACAWIHLNHPRILTDTSVLGPDVGSMKWKLHCIPAIPGVGILVAAKRSGRIRWYKPAWCSNLWSIDQWRCEVGTLAEPNWCKRWLYGSHDLSFFPARLSGVTQRDS